MKPSDLDKLQLGHLIRINVDMDPTALEHNVRDITFRAKRGDIGLVISKNKKMTRFKVLLNTGNWAEVTAQDLDRKDVEILAV